MAKAQSIILALSEKHVVNGSSTADTTAVNTVNTLSLTFVLGFSESFWMYLFSLVEEFLHRQHKTSTRAD